MIELNKLRDEIHNNAVEKGFHEQIEILKKMQESRLFTDKQIEAVSSAFLGQKLMLVVSEIGEALEANREDREPNYYMFEDWQNDEKYSFEDAFKLHIKDTFADELADSIIRLLDLCGLYQIDIEKHVKLKMKYNSLRPKLHGKKY